MHSHTLDPRECASVVVSFRDPGGHLVINGKRVLRVIAESHREAVETFLQTPLSAALIGDQILISTKPVRDSEVGAFVGDISSLESVAPLVVEHRYIEFPSYPYEWPPDMLRAAGELTLDLMERLLAEGYGLKDASPYNILFRGAQPIFVDFLSIEKRNYLDPTWLAYEQYMRTFVRPLLANKYFGLGLHQVFRVYRDGLEPDHVFRMCSLRQKIHPDFLTSVSLPTLLSPKDPIRYEKIYHSRVARSAEAAQFILTRQIRGLRKKLAGAAPDPARRSVWANYEERQSELYKSTKATFLEQSLTSTKPGKMLDIGCNRGFFSVLAARLGWSVVAIDQDAVVLDDLWRKAIKSELDILPLVIDITRPTSGLGWRNSETRSFLERALGSFDCVLMLSVIHHMLVSERIPLIEILRLAYELTTARLIIEWVDPKDDMFRLLTRGNHALYQHLTQELFERLSNQFFNIERSQTVNGGSRRLYEMRRRVV